AELSRETGDAVGEARALKAQVDHGEGGVLVVQRLAEVLRRLDRCELAVPPLQQALAAPDLDKYAAISINVNLGECALDVGPTPSTTPGRPSHWQARHHRAMSPRPRRSWPRPSCPRETSTRPRRRRARACRGRPRTNLASSRCSMPSGCPAVAATSSRSWRPS